MINETSAIPCSNCRKPVPFNTKTTHCPHCETRLAKRFWTYSPPAVYEPTPGDSTWRPVEQAGKIGAVQVDGHVNRELLCIGIGTLFAVVGTFLLLDPSGGSVEFMGRSMEVANLQKLYIGQTSALVGAMFIAVGIRPR